MLYILTRKKVEVLSVASCLCKLLFLQSSASSYPSIELSTSSLHKEHPKVLDDIKTI